MLDFSLQNNSPVIGTGKEGYDIGAISNTIRPLQVRQFDVTADEAQLTINFHHPRDYTNGDSLGNVNYEIRKNGEFWQTTTETEFITDFDGAAEIYEVVAIDENGIRGLPIRSSHIWRGNFPDALIWDPSVSQDGAVIANLMGELNRKVAVVDHPARFPLFDFPVVFLTLGMFPNNYIMRPEQAGFFTPIIENGGSVYLEGAETWYDDGQTELHFNFGLYGNESGEGDLWLVQGKDGTFTEGMEISFIQESQFVDRLIPYQTGFVILENVSPNYVCAVANSTETYRTVGSSVLITGLSEPLDYLDKMLDFLWYEDEQCADWQKGDINQDGILNILDIVMEVNFILNAETPTECEFWSADLNDDEILNVLDIVQLVGLVLNG